jgi:hypothetical protein
VATTATDATAQYKDLAAALRGDARTPGEPGYAARAVYNAMIDKRPAAIVRCNVFPRQPEHRAGRRAEPTAPAGGDRHVRPKYPVMRSERKPK